MATLEPANLRAEVSRDAVSAAKQLKFPTLSLTLFFPLRSHESPPRTTTFRFPRRFGRRVFPRTFFDYECLLSGFSPVEEVIGRLPGLIHAVTGVIEQRQRQPKPHTLSTFLGVSSVAHCLSTCRSPNSEL